MDQEERIALKAACITAAAILLAPLYAKVDIRGDPSKMSADTTNCARHAHDLFHKVTGEPWK
jgi:hypothetical protein